MSQSTPKVGKKVSRYLAKEPILNPTRHLLSVVCLPTWLCLSKAENTRVGWQKHLGRCFSQWDHSL